MADRGKRKHTGGHGDGGKKKKSAYWSSNAKASIPYGSRGFLISCVGGKEQLAAREATHLLTEFYESLHSKEGHGEAPAAAGAGSVDIAAEIASEVADLKQREDELFVHHRTGVSALLYLEMRKEAEGPGPVELITAIAKEVQATKQNRTRLCIRLLPVQNVCHADLKEIGAAAKELTAPHFPAGEGAAPVRFAVAYEHRASVELKRLDVINAVVDQIPQPPHKVDLDYPQATVLVQLLKSCAALALAPDYLGLAKFNLRELATQDEAQVTATRAEKAERGKKAAAEKAAKKAAAAAAGATPPAAEDAAGPSAAAPEPAAAEHAAQHAEEAMPNGHVPPPGAAPDGQQEEEEGAQVERAGEDALGGDSGSLRAQVGDAGAIIHGDDEDDEVSDAAGGPGGPE